MRGLRTALLLLTLAVPAFVVPAFAVEPGERLADPVLEARAREIGQGLRCLVCQNESIDESHADLAHDVRVLLRERLVAGDSDAQATAYIVSRYGDFVLLQPPVKPATYLLWFGPPLLLAVAGAAVAVGLRRRAAQPAEAPLDETERQRLTGLMRESEP
jgi:cytochrome c-type biogenesis protein CcmH